MGQLDGLVVRPATPDDAADLGRIHEQAWTEGLGPLLPPEVLRRLGGGGRRRAIEALARDPGAGHRVLVAEAGGEVVGFAWFGRRPHELPPFEGQLHSLYVRQDCQRAGAGGRLLREAMRALLRDGVGSLMLWVLTANGPARRFYERCGGRLLPAERPFEFAGFRYPSYPMAAYGWEPLAGPLLGGPEAAAWPAAPAFGAATPAAGAGAPAPGGIAVD
jgi:ribosomal protein S18 acetylase RimI-like enzyme